MEHFQLCLPTVQIWQVVVLYSNDCTGFAWADSALVALDRWSFYRSSRLNRFDYNVLS